MGLKDKVAQTFLGKGVKVAIADDDGNASRKAEGNLAGHGDVAFQWIDVSVEEDFKKGVAPAVEKFGHLNIMFNHAGIGLRGETHKLFYEDAQRVIKANRDSVFYKLSYTPPRSAINLMTKSVGLQYAKNNPRASAVLQAMSMPVW
ncbi:SDR family oxidoreductase [Salinicoccus siamensis]|uniref:SDR family oxidoreductase n=1 Tax=Salinicoccus siamensis TaxID=381830 RepID=A0ABV5Z600_9STAP